MNPAIMNLLEGYYRPKRSTRKLFWVGGLVLFVAGMLFALSAVLFDIEVPGYVCSPTDVSCIRAHQARAGEFAGNRAMMALVPLAIAVLAFATWWPIRNPQVPALTAMLRDRPNEIVWIFPKKTTTYRRGVVIRTRHEIMFGTESGKIHELGSREHDVPQAMALFCSVVPHASVGHTDELERQFKQNPASLRKSGMRPAPAGGPAPAGVAPPAAGPTAPLVVAPNVSFAQLDHGLRAMGFAPEGYGPLIAAGEPAHAAWSGGGARVMYRVDGPSRSRLLDVQAHDAAGVRARIASTGLGLAPIGGGS